MDLHRTVSASLEEIAGVRHAVITFLEELGFPEENAFEVGMALAEALANAIVHGCRKDPGKHITVHVSCDPTRVCLIVRDCGTGFDPARLADPASPQGLVAHRGRGIHMMKAYMDDVAFANGGREVRMRKNWPARSGAQSA